MDADQRRALDLDRRHAGRRTARHASLLLHWLGRLVRRPAPVETVALPWVARGQVAVTFGGHASALLRYADLTIACDPMLGGSIGAIRREVAAGHDVRDLADVDLVLIGHGDPDHLHLPTLARVPRSSTVVVPPGIAARVSPLGFARLVELRPGGSFVHGKAEVAAVAARGDRPALAYLVRGDGPSVFVSTDGGYSTEFGEAGRRFRPDVALLPIGGYAPRSFRARHMSPLDAVCAFEDLGARVLVPIRHGAFALSYERLDEPARWLAELIVERRLEAHVVVLRPGESRLFALPVRRGVAAEAQHAGVRPDDVGGELGLGPGGGAVAAAWAAEATERAAVGAGAGELDLDVEVTEAAGDDAVGSVLVDLEAEAGAPRRG